MAQKACHAFASTTQVDLIQALELMKIIVFLLFLIATNAHAADSFSDRVTKARRAEHMLENRPALTSFMNETMGKSETAMSNCFKNTPPPTFTLVADLMPGGHIANVAIEPLAPNPH